jgi:flagellar basal-body rod modification protein FlgD
MATVGTLFPATSTTAATASTTAQAASSTTASGSDSLSNQNTFLQLLVAQLQYQDPTQPMDGTTFVTQLATFSDLQANMGSKTDLDAISKQYVGSVPSATDSTAAASTTSSAATAAALPTDTSTLLAGSGS